MIAKELRDTFLQLIRLGAGTSENEPIADQIEWEGLLALAEEQDLSAVLADGMSRLPLTHRPPKYISLQIIGQVLKNYELRFELYQHAIAGLAGFYNEHGYKMMVLKGYACSLDWPKPEHRPAGDVDIWQFGQQKAADALLASEKGVKVDSSHHHHTVFRWQGFTVENHYDFINVHHHKSNLALESILKDLGKDDSRFVELFGERVSLPSANLHALFLLRHTSAHFASTGMNLRQLLDWGFFVEKQGADVDWPWLIGVAEKYGMKRFLDCMNMICVKDLGFSFNVASDVDNVLKERILNDIFTREFEEKAPSGFVKRAVFKFRRWRANGWKHRLCYNESMWSAFWSGVKNHLLKPSSI